VAFQFADSFDTYANASWRYETVSGTISYSSAYARFAPPAGLPGQGIKFVSNGSGIFKNMQSNQPTFIKRVALNFAGLGTHPINPFMGVLDSSTYQWTVAVSPSGNLLVLTGNTGATQATSGPGLIATNLWYGLEIEVTVSASVGTANVWLNGLQVMTVTGIVTQSSANAYGNRVSLGDLNDNGLAGLMADDFRVWDATGSYQNAPTGTDGRLISKLASGAGAFAQFTPNGAAANWQCTDENPPNAGTTYVSGSSSGLVDAYGMPAAAFSAAPVMVVAESYASKSDGATRSVEIGVNSSGVQGYGAGFTVSNSYAFIQSCISLDPNTGAVWTAAAADAAQHCKQETA
jgi:hypothetical protein